MPFTKPIFRAAPLTFSRAQGAANDFGIKGGLNWSDLLTEGKDVSEEYARWGFNAGEFGRIAATDNAGSQVELPNATKGTTVVHDGHIDQRPPFNLAYAEMPSFLAVRLGDVLELHAGSYAGYQLESDVTSDGDHGSTSPDNDRDNFTSMDFGLLGDAGNSVGQLYIAFGLVAKDQ